MQLDEALLAPGTSFVRHEEVKKSDGQRKVLKVYLIDSEGKQHLAATGEDLGDAHYHYRNTRPFSKYGVIDCHNRKELIQWLEVIISETSIKEGPHLDVNEQNPEGVYFTSHKYERAHMNDGRRINRWYLVDQHGSAHLAVIGVERDTKDGHYNYTAEEPFASRIPLACSNQSGVFKWLEKWITHHAGAGTGVAVGNGQASGTISTVTGASGMDSSARKQPLFISLSAIRQARKSAAALLAANAMVVDPNFRARPKPKKAPTPAAPGLQDTASAQAGSKQRTIGIVQQNQIKKARKLQEDAKAEHERLVAGHTARLRRAAAVELQGDDAAKQITMSWLQGNFTEVELGNLEHWITLLKAVLDLHQKQQQQQQQGAVGSEEQEQKQQVQAIPAEQPAHSEPTAAENRQQQEAGAQLQQQQAEQASRSSILGSTAAAVEGPGLTDKELLAWLRQEGSEELYGWLRQEGNQRHYLRVMLECLKEIGVMDLPARVLLGHKVIALVQRCLSAPLDAAVKSLAQHMLQRWKWQLAGHMQVLTNPMYMEDHLAVLDEDIAAGAVPLPQLPMHKQALINTALPTFAGTASGRLQQYTPAHSSHHQQQQRPSQAAAAGRAAAAAAADAGSAAGLGSDQAAGYSPAVHMDRLGQQAGLTGLQAHFGNTGFATTPLALSGLYRSGSPALAAAIGAQLQASMGQPLVLGPGQQMTLFSYTDPAAATVDAFGVNGTAGGLTWPYGSVGLPALGAAGQQYALGGAAVPLLQQQQYSHYIGMPQQLYLQQPGLVAVASSAQLQQAVLQQQQQQLGMGRVSSGFFTQQQQQGDAAQLLQQQQQQQWLGFLQQPASSQVSEQQPQGSVQ